MIQRVYRGTLLALYQISLAVGILLMPLALVANRAGVTLPIHRLIDRLDSAYEGVKEP
ncbi:hypothetical protein [Halostella litorea]|uniref:hypothetical protein n=1 Tax=Halostella litorea TaxID=2528831 RepID=UPI00192A632B|nr:hypothetical protein [Halostella litorea]